MSERKKYESLGEALNALPEKTRKHSERVAEYMRVIFIECCYSNLVENDQKAEARLHEDLAEMAYRVGLYHDIGKALIPEELHFYSSDFSNEEKALYRKHIDYTTQMIFDLYRKEFGCGAREETYAYEALSSKNEFWNGSGYPQGLEGKKIPVIARILAAVDTMDNMSATLHSEKPLDEAIAFLEEMSDVKFDRKVVEIIRKNRGAISKIFRSHLADTNVIPKIAPVVPAAAAKNFRLEYRPVISRETGRISGLEAKPLYRLGDRMVPYDAVAHIFADTKEIQNKQTRRDLCLLCAAEACDMLRQCDAAKTPVAYITVDFPAAFLKQSGITQDLLALCADEDIDPCRLKVRLPAALLGGGTSVLYKNISTLAAAGIETVMTGAALADEAPEKGTVTERPTVTPEDVIASGIRCFGLSEADAAAADSEEGIRRFRKLREAGIVLIAENLDAPELAGSLALMEIGELTGALHGAYGDRETTLARLLAEDKTA